MAEESLQVLVFEVGGRRYGLPVSNVQELLRAVTITPLPHALEPVEGFINLRGTIVPVLDIRTRFQLPTRPVEYTDHFIVAQAGKRLVALRVERALDLVSLEASAVEDARSMVTGLHEVKWLARLAGELVPVLDLDNLLARTVMAASNGGLSLSEKGGAP